MINVDGISNHTRDLLVASLSAAVPLWISVLADLEMDFILERAKKCGAIVAEKGDIILYKSKHKGASAAAFNALAEGLACLAFCPGGVRFLGLHWEATIGAE